MKNKKGFTLTELLVVIALIAVLGSIIIYSTIGINNSSKDLQYERMVENIKNSAKTYVSLYPDEFSELYSSRAFTYISLSEIIKAGFLDEDIVNPYTNKNIDLDSINEGFIKVYVDGDSREMTYIYPVSDDEYNTSYWLQSETIYNYYDEDTSSFKAVYAYDGLTLAPATTKLSIADENGKIVQKEMVDSSILKVYKDKFELSHEDINGLDRCTNPGENGCPAAADIAKDATIGDYYVPKKSGSYEIKYHWSYTRSDGTKVNRVDTRKVIVTSSSEEEKNQASTQAVTTASTEATTSTAEGIIYECPYKEFNGAFSTNSDTFVVNGNNAFTVYIKGKIERTTNTEVVLVDNYSASGGSFRVYFVPGNNYISIRSYISDVTLTTNLDYVPGNTFKLVFGVNPTVDKKTMNISYIPNVNVSKPTITSKTMTFNYRESNMPMIVGSYRNTSSTDPKYITAHIDRLAVYNKFDMSLINS